MNYGSVDRIWIVWPMRTLTLRVRLELLIGLYVATLITSVMATGLNEYWTVTGLWSSGELFNTNNGESVLFLTVTGIFSAFLAVHWTCAKGREMVEALQPVFDDPTKLALHWNRFCRRMNRSNAAAMLLGLCFAGVTGLPAYRFVSRLDWSPIREFGIYLTALICLSVFIIGCGLIYVVIIGWTAFQARTLFDPRKQFLRALPVMPDRMSGLKPFMDFVFLVVAEWFGLCFVAGFLIVPLATRGSAAAAAYGGVLLVGVAGLSLPFYYTRRWLVETRKMLLERYSKLVEQTWEKPSGQAAMWLLCFNEAEKLKTIPIYLSPRSALAVVAFIGHLTRLWDWVPVR